MAGAALAAAGVVLLPVGLATVVAALGAFAGVRAVGTPPPEHELEPGP